MARRLVVAGVRFVTVEHGNWDTHTKNFESLQTNLLPTLDAALATLLRDLAEHGCSTTRWSLQLASLLARRASTRTPAAITGRTP